MLMRMHLKRSTTHQTYRCLYLASLTLRNQLILPRLKVISITYRHTTFKHLIIAIRRQIIIPSYILIIQLQLQIRFLSLIIQLGMLSRRLQILRCRYDIFNVVVLLMLRFNWRLPQQTLLLMSLKNT